MLKKWEEIMFLYLKKLDYTLGALDFLSHQNIPCCLLHRESIKGMVTSKSAN